MLVSPDWLCFKVFRCLDLFYRQRGNLFIYLLASIVGIVSSYGLKCLGFKFRQRQDTFSSPELSRPRPLSSGYKGSFTGRKAACACIWLHTSIHRVELYVFFPYVPSWCGQGRLYLFNFASNKQDYSKWLSGF